MEVTQVEDKVERIRAGAITINEKVGGMLIETVEQLYRISDALAGSGVMVPPHCRNQPKTVFAILVQSQEWGLPFMGVINQSYVTKGRGGVERVAYQAQLVHTLIETRAGLAQKLREEFIGEGEDMICKVSGIFKGEKEPHVWESEPVGIIREQIGWNEQGNFRGSPLWVTKPRMQLHYATTRDWARAHCPWVILGVYTPEDIEDGKAIEEVKEPSRLELLAQRLKERKEARGRGFDPDHVQRETMRPDEGVIIEGESNAATEGRVDQPTDEERRDDTGDRGLAGEEQVGGDSAGQRGPDDGQQPAGASQQAEAESEEGDVFPPDRITSGPQSRAPLKPKGKR